MNFYIIFSHLIVVVLFFNQILCHVDFTSEKKNTYRNSSYEALNFPMENEVYTYGRNIHMRNKRSVNEPFNANSKTDYIETVIVIDNDVFQSFSRNIAEVHQYCNDLISKVNSIFSSLNIYVVLTDVIIWMSRPEIQISRDAAQTLNNFLKYRASTLNSAYPNDLAVFLTDTLFDQSVTGKALIQSMCTKSFSGVIVRKLTSKIDEVALIVAHEIGHTLGMKHDEKVPGCRCQEDHCVMSERTHSKLFTQWSSCSIEELSKSLSKGLNLCLKNKPNNIFGSYCGNGFIDPGEECDCGLPSMCTNKCCNPYTCKLKAKASCGTGECCDLNSCKIKAANYKCREIKTECDLSEYCDGRSEFCPSDGYKNDGSYCDNGNSYCYKGNCGSRQKQCQALWGFNAISSDECYDLNKRGEKFGNCGGAFDATIHQPCSETDKLCGLLQCSHYNPEDKLEKLETSLFPENYIWTHESFVVKVHKEKKDWMACKSANFDLISIDPGITPNGAKCGNNQMCIDQKCISLDKINQPELRPQPIRPIPFTTTTKPTVKPNLTCAKGCSGKGRCNAIGKCECFDGYLPPFCERSKPQPIAPTSPIRTTKPSVKPKITCKNNCNGNGRCSTIGKCECFYGYLPPFCEKSKPQPKPQPTTPITPTRATKPSVKPKITCKNNCNDNGRCNAIGQCECFEGYLPPLCEEYDYNYDYVEVFTENLPEVLVPGRNQSCSDGCIHFGKCAKTEICECFEGLKPPFCFNTGTPSRVETEDSKLYVYIIVMVIVLITTVLGLGIYFLYKKNKLPEKLVRRTSKIYSGTTRPISEFISKSHKKLIRRISNIEDAYY